ncbi:MAG: hypothetical protein CMO98_05535 [Woeseia sp.]|nr:hypothetical protein [Woeseia sp.]|tara:strand:+ start:103 stop:738 length:636 start_codon:yes stop_codon:yes gene_type:complete
MISRRHFILGTAAGLVLPSYYDKVLAYFENHGEVYLDKPKSHDIEIRALYCEDDTYEFHIGDPHEEPPAMTIREYARRYHWSEQELWKLWWEDHEGVSFDGDTFDSFDWDKELSFDEVWDAWARNDSSFSKAYRFLEPIDLGASLQKGHAAGELMFLDGPLSMAGWDYLGVRAGNMGYGLGSCESAAATISLLQKRLNELDMGVLITMAEE